MPLTIAPYKTKLNHGNAYWMAKLSKAVYTERKDNYPDAEKILKDLKNEDPGFIAIKPFSSGDAQAMFVEHEQYLCMAFRGTDDAGDWLDNFTITKEKLNGTDYEFHKGFMKQFNALWADLENAYNESNLDGKGNKKQARPLFFTGHSLGGAVATIATAKWVLDGDRQFTSTYTFGQPRATTLETSRAISPMFGSRFFRFHNNNDIVPRVPLRINSYSHMGQIVYIDKDKEMHTDPGFWFRFQDQVRGVLEARKEEGIDFAKDHDMDNYLYAVKNWDMQD